VTTSAKAEDATPSLGGLLLGLGPEAATEYGDLAIGDTTGIRLVSTDVGPKGVIHVYYEFSVDRVTALVEVGGAEDQLAEIDAQALDFALAEEAHLRGSA